MSNEERLVALQRAVERMHGVPARFVDSTPVHEKSGDLTVWQGLVSKFELKGHATASVCYAWKVPSEGESRDRFYAVLQTPEVDTPAKAVMASVVADHRDKSHRGTT